MEQLCNGLRKLLEFRQIMNGQHAIGVLVQHFGTGRQRRIPFKTNPLLRFEGYAPLATGAKVLHQHADGMLAIHNLSELEQLARAIAQLLNTRRGNMPSSHSRRIPLPFAHS